MVHYDKLPQDVSPVIPWWTLNGYITENEAKRQLDDFCAEGISEFFLYPNFGLENPDFLSEKWFDFIAFLFKECPRRGLRFWIYDELNWPSGSAGGRLPDEHPEYLMRTMRRNMLELQPGESWVPEADCEYIWCGVFHSADSLPQELPTDKTYTNIGSTAEKILTVIRIFIDDQFLCCMGTENTRNQRGIIDALNPAAVRCCGNQRRW